MNLKNLDFYSSKFLKIITKTQGLQNLVFNSYQKQLTEITEQLKKDNKPIRIIILKPRQIGISTWGSAYIFHNSVTNRYRKSLIVADNDENTSKLFNWCKNYYSFLDSKMQPMKKYSNAKELIFANPDDKAIEKGLLSGISIESAQKPGGRVGMSGSLQNVHLSEFAYYPNAGSVITSVAQSVPLKSDTFILIESTANGISGKGEQFYEYWQNAMQGNGFYPVFFDWLDNPEYEIDPEPGFELDPYEKELYRKYPKYNLKKIAFRRYKIKNEMGSALVNPEDQFKQEYPHVPEEAFLSSGRPVFPAEKILDRINVLRGTKFKKYSVTNKTLYEDEKSFLTLKETKKQAFYVIGADVAEGLESGDFSAACILDKSFRQIGWYHGHVAPDLFGKELCKIGEYFNNAVLAVESNNHGHATNAAIKNLHYPRIYTRVSEDEQSDKMTPKIGWNTNSKTKIKMLDDFVAMFRDDLLEINDIELLKEMMTLKIESDGDICLNGKDRVVSICIAIQAIKQMPTEQSGVYNPNERFEPPNYLHAPNYLR